MLLKHCYVVFTYLLDYSHDRAGVFKTTENYIIRDTKSNNGIIKTI